MVMKGVLSIFLCLIFTGNLSAETQKLGQKLGKGSLETKDNQMILHVSGTPYEMGYQHGALLKDQIQKNIDRFINKPRAEQNDRVSGFSQNVNKLASYIPQRFLDEMKGVADGSGIPYQKVLLLNLFPEMFHCAAITTNKEASKEGKLYHMRVLDYGIGKGLQSTAVLIACEPNDGYSFVNVSYAGFVGSITGMNSQKIGLGEIGGAGYGNWDGMPMSFLMRDVLENASSLDEAKAIFSSTPRTCEYYYAISDGNSNTACGVYATASQINFIEPGSNYALVSLPNLPKNYGADGLNDKFFLTNFDSKTSSYQAIVYNAEGKTVGIFNRQLPNCISMTGYTGAERYSPLIERMYAAYGSIDEKALAEMIKPPVTKETNLHNAIFLPAELKLWVSHAGPNDEPAAQQPYKAYSFDELFQLDNLSDVVESAGDDLALRVK